MMQDHRPVVRPVRLGQVATLAVALRRAPRVQRAKAFVKGDAFRSQRLDEMLTLQTEERRVELKA